MLVSKAVTIFEVLQDKYGSPNIITSEIIDHFNMAVGEYLNRLFPDTQGGLANWEQDELITSNLQPLIYTLSLATTAGGAITNTTINTALATAASEVGATYFRVGSVGITSGSSKYPAKYIKQNNLWAYEKNSFKVPSTAEPGYTLVATGLQFYPAGTYSNVSLNVVKTPKFLTTADLATSFEFSDYVVYNIISIALKLAGISTRDTEYLEDARLAGLQINQ